MQTKRISADEAHAARKEHLRLGPDGKERGLLKVASAPSTWNAEKRSARFVMTSQSKDRYGDVVVTNGADISEFEKNPVAFLNHNSHEWPIGKWENVAKMTKARPPRMEGDLVLLEEDSPIPQATQAAWMIERGHMRACSIGFIPDWNEIEMMLDGEGNWTGGLQFNKSEIIECSLCGVPANQDALAKDFTQHAAFALESVEYVLDNYARDADGDLIQREAFDHLYKVLSLDEAAPSLDELFAKLDAEGQRAFCEKYASAAGQRLMDAKAVERNERAALQERLRVKRQRKIEALKLRGL